MMKKIGVLLSGCGVFDGSEIQEVIMTTYFLTKKDVEICYMAPNINQSVIVNHSNSSSAKGERNVLVESARIVRGNVKDIAEISPVELDALIIPGGVGVIANLCSFVERGIECEVNQDVADLITNMVRKKKTIGAICIAPVLVAKVLSIIGVTGGILTIGNDQNLVQAIQAMGAVHLECAVKDIVIDSENCIISSPAYMIGKDIAEISLGIEKLVDRVVEMVSL